MVAEDSHTQAPKTPEVEKLREAQDHPQNQEEGPRGCAVRTIAGGSLSGSQEILYLLRTEVGLGIRTPAAFGLSPWGHSK